MTTKCNGKWFLKIEPDYDSENPWPSHDRTFYIYTNHRNYHHLGNEKLNDAAINFIKTQVRQSKRYLENPKAYKKPTHLIFRMYAYIHSGITLSTSNAKYPFNDRFDSGLLAYASLTVKEAEEMYGTDLSFDELCEKANVYWKSHVDILDMWLNEEVYHFSLHRYGEHINSLGNIYTKEIDEIKRCILDTLTDPTNSEVKEIEKLLENLTWENNDKELYNETEHLAEMAH